MAGKMAMPEKIFKKGLILGIQTENPAIVSQESAFEYWVEEVFRVNFLKEIWKRGYYGFENFIFGIPLQELKNNFSRNEG